MKSEIANRVQDFYRDLPFSYYSTTQQAAKSLQHNSIELTYPDLHRLLAESRASGPIKVIEFGSGAGWLSCTLAKFYDVRVVAVDFTEKAIQRSRELAHSLGVDHTVEYVHHDFLNYPAEPKFDLAISMGVLHHTADAKAAYQHLAKFVRLGGYLHVGLYHLYGRRPFLEFFRKLRESKGDAAALAAYAKLDAARQADETHLESWYRDQVVHPHETQHTLEEVVDWLDRSQWSLCSTSINRFAKITDSNLLFELEKEYEQISHDAIHVDQRYFPGFFTILNQNQATDAS